MSNIGVEVTGCLQWLTNHTASTHEVTRLGVIYLIFINCSQRRVLTFSLLKKRYVTFEPQHHPSSIFIVKVFSVVLLHRILNSTYIFQIFYIISLEWYAKFIITVTKKS